MYKFQLLSDLALFICTAIGFFYGTAKFFKKGKALYLQIIVCALGCMMLGRLFQLVALITARAYSTGFNVGTLGIIGSFCFFFSANYGQMDSLVDEGTKELKKYRIIALIAPVLIILGVIPVITSDCSLESKIVCCVVAFFIMPASYFNLKHILIPDVEFGIIRSIRGYNILALGYAILSVAEIVVVNFMIVPALIFVYILICLESLMMIPVIERGVKGWTT